jgi:hypothetical protein
VTSCGLVDTYQQFIQTVSVCNATQCHSSDVHDVYCVLWSLLWLYEEPWSYCSSILVLENF